MTRTKATRKLVSDSEEDLAGHRKQLGQYFTGGRLARLLTAISGASHFRSAIDPMCGSGDMLAAVREISPAAHLCGIEIDPSVYETSTSRLHDPAARTPELLLGDAFSWHTISQLSRYNFDLVITNPPYVRYQSIARDSQTDALGRGELVRQQLIQVAQNLDGIQEKDREIFISIINGYSGLSDLAVPSWILCALLTAPGGRLSMVVPESWLNRDYAYPIHYLLLKFFRILWVVEDAHRVWFDEAQIKTTLIVAERVSHADDIKTACSGKAYLHVAVPGSAVTESSIIGRIFPNAENPETAFALELLHLSSDDTARASAGLSITRCGLDSKLANLVAASRGSDWFRICEPEMTRLASDSDEGLDIKAKIPQALLDLLPRREQIPITTIEALGGGVGQGLRTGANEFFYCDLISEDKDQCLVAPGKALNMFPTFIPKAALRPALRKQSELPGGYILIPSQLSGRVLVLDQFIHPEDLSAETRKIDHRFDFAKEPNRVIMTAALADLVSVAAHTNLGTEKDAKLIPQMSAVRTNETKSKNGTRARYWYMLPPLAKRHLPDLLIARINYSHPKAIMNSEERTIIDANFSTIWMKPDASIDAFALFACLNCSWVIAAMELSAAVLGGGALKLEAAHLRRLPIPDLALQQWTELSTLGQRLVANNDIEGALAEIDRLIASALFGREKTAGALAVIEQIKQERLSARKQK